VTQTYGKPPVDCGHFPDVGLTEVMYYLYLPIFMAEQFDPTKMNNLRVPQNVRSIQHLIDEAILCEYHAERRWKYLYLSARKGWATPDNPLNRPGWHCDGFGSPDMNYIWWSGPGTRFAVGDFGEISDDHVVSMRQFEERAVTRGYAHDRVQIEKPPGKHLYQIDRYVVHATPILRKGCMRQFVKISFSNERYNLYNNSHNYLFDYDWPMVDRDTVRNDTSKAQGDHA
jgi:hypothetical protein